MKERRGKKDSKLWPDQLEGWSYQLITWRTEGLGMVGKEEELTFGCASLMPLDI